MDPRESRAGLLRGGGGGALACVGGSAAAPTDPRDELKLA